MPPCTPLEKVLRTRLEALKTSGSLRSLNRTAQGLDLQSNDYLGLAHDDRLFSPFIKQVAASLAEEHFPMMGSGASRLLQQDQSESIALERTAAHMHCAEHALLFNSGYHANTGLLPALAQLGNGKIYLDSLVHASIIDGLRLSRLPFARFNHNDVAHLEALLAQDKGRYDFRYIVVESLYSMTGDTAPLADLVALKRTYPEIVLYVDEAHAIGALGPHGCGLVAESGLQKDIDILVVPCGKALAGMGAYVVAGELLTEWWVNMARPLIFSTMLPPLSIAWLHYVLRQLPSCEKRRESLSAKSDYLRSKLVEMGYRTGGQHHIVPIYMGSNEAANSLAQGLQKEGFFTLPIRFPTVPKGQEMVRLSLTETLSWESIYALEEGLKKLNKR